MAVFPRVGDQFGRYRIDGQIGQGGMGVVFHATDTTFDRPVALKVVLAVLGGNEEFQQRFDREAAVLARLDSPHVIKIFDYGITDDTPYIATQYVGGGDLGKLMDLRGAMPPTLAASVCGQVAEALHDAHRVGVVHRDVKPTNVLLRDADTPDLYAYLCDFGIARTANDGLTAPGSVAGTWSYLAPECGRGEPGTPASDIYALGCLFWATLTGRAPYSGTDVQIAVAHQRSPIPQLSESDEFSRRANVILARSMAKDPAERYPDADSLRTDLLAAGGASSSGITPLPVTPPVTPGVPQPATAGAPFEPRTDVRAAAPGTPGGGRLTTILAALIVAVIVVAGSVLGVTLARGGDDDPGDEGPGTADGVTRLDEGGPITMDLDGDGLGDTGLDFSHPPANASGPDGDKNVSDATTWRSDGTAFVDEDEQVLDDDPDTGSLRFPGNVDSDETTDLFTIVYDNGAEDPDQQISITGTTSDGSEVDSSFPNTDDYTGYPRMADVDDDGDDDLILTAVPNGDDPVTKPIRLLLSTYEDGEFADPTPWVEIPEDLLDSRIDVGDFDGDGLADVVSVTVGEAINNATSRITLRAYFGDGTTVTPGPSLTFKARSSIQLVTADVDGDEADEIALGVENLGDFKLRVAQVSREEIEKPTAGGITSTGFVSFGRAMGVSDVNGDGLDDILLVTGVSGSTANNEASVQVFRSTGDRFLVGTWATFKRTFRTYRTDESVRDFIDILGDPAL